MTLYQQIRWSWHWRRLFQERRILDRLMRENGFHAPAVVAQNRRLDRRCAILYQIETGQGERRFA